MKTKQNIFLIGMMGTGKTTIGKKLAKHLQLAFYDSDQEIEKHTHATISWIFELEGEAKFRQREAEMLNKLTHQQGVVVATGGGAVLLAENRQRLQERGTVIYLYATVEVLTKRTRHGGRPLLEQKEPNEALSALFVQREPLYREIADLSYNTAQCSLQELLKKITRDLRKIQFPSQA